MRKIFALFAYVEWLNVVVPAVLEGKIMRKEYDFSKMKGEKNPYIKGLKTQIAIRLDKETVEYFKS